LLALCQPKIHQLSFGGGAPWESLSTSPYPTSVAGEGGNKGREGRRRREGRGGMKGEKGREAAHLQKSATVDMDGCVVSLQCLSF